MLMAELGKALSGRGGGGNTVVGASGKSYQRVGLMDLLARAS